MGQNSVKSAFNSNEAEQRVKALKNPDQVIKNFEELKQILKYIPLFIRIIANSVREPKIRKELGFQIEIYYMSNLNSPITRLFLQNLRSRQISFQFRKPYQ